MKEKLANFEIPEFKDMREVKIFKYIEPEVPYNVVSYYFPVRVLVFV